MLITNQQCVSLEKQQNTNKLIQSASSLELIYFTNSLSIRSSETVYSIKLVSRETIGRQKKSRMKLTEYSLFN